MQKLLMACAVSHSSADLKRPANNVVIVAAGLGSESAVLGGGAQLSQAHAKSALTM
jgi:hypothetical protein